MNPAIKIRRIKVTDTAGLFQLWQSVYREGLFFEKGPPSIQVLQQILTRVAVHNLPSFVAASGQNIVGAAEVLPTRFFQSDDTGNDTTGKLGIQIHRDYRYQGLGRKLMEEVISDSRRYGFNTITLYVHQQNQPAIDLYNAMGFELTGQGGMITLPSGVQVRNQIMTLKL
ncbi:N-acetyltransferase family protein [Endozoicomonadaceae bacterium StTr2]